MAQAVTVDMSYDSYKSLFREKSRAPGSPADNVNPLKGQHVLRPIPDISNEKSGSILNGPAQSTTVNFHTSDDSFSTAVNSTVQEKETRTACGEMDGFKGVEESTVSHIHNSVAPPEQSITDSKNLSSSAFEHTNGSIAVNSAQQDEANPSGPVHQSAGGVETHLVNGSSVNSISPAVPSIFEKHERDSRETALAFANQNYGTGNEEQIYDMICVGFGPASLAIAIALADAFYELPLGSRRLPKILFLEKQDHFAWHAGMQLPNAKMQISYQKDLATPRDGRSPFSFISYLQSKGRFNHFINLGTFLPSRLEYEDYLRWCASHFEKSVVYSSDVARVLPALIDNAGKVTRFEVCWNCKGSNVTENVTENTFARHVVIAAGGKPFIPKDFTPFTTGDVPRVMHSSRYATTVSRWQNLFEERSQAGKLLGELLLGEPGTDSTGLLTAGAQSNSINRLTEASRAISHAGLSGSRLSFVVIGSGQSAAEIFDDLWNRFPDAKVSLVIRGAALRPSDDSPFVNEIFDPERVDNIYAQDPEERREAIKLDRGTNYGVVRLTLLEHIYEKLYMQRIQEPDPLKWRCQILTNRTIVGVTEQEDSSLLLQLNKSSHVRRNPDAAGTITTLNAHHIFVATGYVRNAHEDMLKETASYLPQTSAGAAFPVGRDYKVQYDKQKVDENCGVWLQGCNESTHGLSDSLLSILAVRGGEMVQSIFGNDIARQRR